MELGNIMTKNVETVNKNTSLDEAANLMKQYNVGSIPVCEGDKVVGIITDRDIVLRGVANGMNPSNVRCGDAMSADVITGTTSMDVHEAARLMAAKQIRRLPIVENSKLVGIISLGDLAVESNLSDDAGEALNDISRPSKPIM